MIQNKNDFFLEKEDVREIIPIRRKHTHKYDYGFVIVIAGSSRMAGAAALCANAALKAGAGMVKLITPQAHPSIYPEIMTHEVKTSSGTFSKDCYKMSRHTTSKFDAMVIGPGINNTVHFVRDNVLNNLTKYIVIDAEGLGAFSLEDKLGSNVVLTPHYKEIMKLRKDDSDLDITNTDHLIYLAKDTAQKMECNVLLKGPTTIITDGERTYYDNFGNPGMATAGSGDVLAGIIGANIAKLKKNVFEMDLLKVIALSSLLHSLSGDYYAEHNDMETLTATEIINNIKNVIKMYKGD